jgi:hypothetical protein
LVVVEVSLFQYINIDFLISKKKIQKISLFYDINKKKKKRKLIVSFLIIANQMPSNQKRVSFLAHQCSGIEDVCNKTHLD